jgi:hypothetical protein
MRGTDRSMLADSLLMAHSGLVSREGNFSRAARELAASMATAAALEQAKTAPKGEVSEVVEVMGSESRKLERGKFARIMRIVRRLHRDGTSTYFRTIWQRFEGAITLLESDGFTHGSSFVQTMTSGESNRSLGVTETHSGSYSTSRVTERNRRTEGWG